MNDFFSKKYIFKNKDCSGCFFFIGGRGVLFFSFLIGGEIGTPRGVSAYESLSGEG